MLRSRTMQVSPDNSARPSDARGDDFREVPSSALPPLDAPGTAGAFVLAHTVRDDECSALVPHANNIVILSWIDLVASRHGDAAGASRAELAVRGRMWFVARHEIDYLGEAFAGDALLLATWVEKLGRTSLVRATRIVRARDGAVLTRATSRWALVDLASRRPVAIDDDARRRLLPP